MLDSELLGHISDESDRFLDQLVLILEDLRDNKIGIFDWDAWDERRRKVRSALMRPPANRQLTAPTGLRLRLPRTPKISPNCLR